MVRTRRSQEPAQPAGEPATRVGVLEEAPVRSEDGRFVLLHGAWVPRDRRCPACGADDGLSAYPGQFPRCFRCRATIIRAGRAPSADCVSPNGRIDGHGAYVRTRPDGTMVCAFCDQPWRATLPRGCVRGKGGF